MQRRNTVQRQIILDAVMMLDHPNADEVYSYLQGKYPTISKGTIYRNLNLLAEEEQIVKVATSSGADRFDYIQPKHYHMRCKCCGKVFDALLPIYETPTVLPTHSGDFSIEGHTLELIGTCSNCLNKTKNRKGD